MPPEPPAEAFHLDTDQVVPRLVDFIREEVARAGRKGVVLGMSGGIDSSLVAHLAVRALDPGNVHGYLLPFRTSSRESLLHARMEIDKLGMPHQTIDITPTAEALFQLLPNLTRRRMGNAMARLRMAVLYDQSEEQEALVIGTSNRTEMLLGYGTIHGDAAWAIDPIGGLYKTQVRHLSRQLGVDPAIVEKVPTADLWAGQTDEGELGVSYEMADRVLYLLIDRGMARDQIVDLGYPPEAVDRVVGLVAASAFKRCMPPVAMLES
ncbi:MAG: NAD+ synthase [Chloroflexota bacterium]